MCYLWCPPGVSLRARAVTVYAPLSWKKKNTEEPQCQTLSIRRWHPNLSPNFVRQTPATVSGYQVRGGHRQLNESEVVLIGAPYQAGFTHGHAIPLSSVVTKPRLFPKLSLSNLLLPSLVHLQKKTWKTGPGIHHPVGLTQQNHPDAVIYSRLRCPSSHRCKEIGIYHPCSPLAPLALGRL